MSDQQPKDKHFSLQLYDREKEEICETRETNTRAFWPFCL